MEKLLAAGANHDHQDDVRNLVTRVVVIHVLSIFIKFLIFFKANNSNW